MKTHERTTGKTYGEATLSTPQATATGEQRSFRGRKHKRNNPELVKLLEDALLIGNTQKVACEIAGIHPATFCAWMKEGGDAREGTVVREFYERIKKAMTEAVSRNVGLIQKHAEKSWQAAAWFLERRCPEEWGLKQRIEQCSPEDKSSPAQEEPEPRLNLSVEEIDKAFEKMINVRAQAKARGLAL